MRNIILTLVVVMFLAVVFGEDAPATQAKSYKKPRNRIIPSSKLIEERYSNGDFKKCQIFRMWKIKGRLIGCCTDNRSIPLTLCTDRQGNTIAERTEIADYKCSNPWCD